MEEEFLTAKSAKNAESGGFWYIVLTLDSV
jgi:hypothetical protein